MPLKSYLYPVRDRRKCNKTIYAFVALGMFFMSQSVVLVCQCTLSVIQCLETPF